MRTPLAALVVLGLAPHIVAAEATAADLERARTFYNAGRDAFYAAKYDVAITALERALALAPGRASVQLALGKAYRFQYVIDGDGAKAARSVELLRAYVAQVSEGDDRREAVAIIGELAEIADRYAHAFSQQGAAPVRAKTALLVASHTPGAKASVDRGAPVSLPAIVEVAAGDHPVHVEADGFIAQDITGTAIAGQVVPVEVVLAERPGTLRVTAADGSDVAIDGRSIGVAPLASIALPSGHHFLAVTSRGLTAFSRDLSIHRGDTLAVEAHQERTDKRTAAYIVAGGAAAAAIGGITASVLAVHARSDADAISSLAPTGTLSEQQLIAQNQHVDAFDRDATLSYVLYGGAAALLATAIYLYLSDTPRAESPPTIVVAPVATPSGASISIGGRLP